MTQPLRLAVAGCTGRMGRAVVRLASAEPALRIVAGVTIANDPDLGKNVGILAGASASGVLASLSVEQPCDMLIDFTSPLGCVHWAAWCAAQRVKLVSGTTGLEDVHHRALRETAAKTAVLWSPNMSIGVNLLLKLVEQTSRILDDSWDIEIVEGHHNRKADAPSGTARALLESVCSGRGVKAESVAIHGREGQVGARKRGEIGIHAVRMGGVVGDHDVHFATTGEIVTLRHHAESRDIFAAGALRAATWIAGKAAGLYHMRDALA